jgi:hypothetical protein
MAKLVKRMQGILANRPRVQRDSPKSGEKDPKVKGNAWFFDGLRRTKYAKYERKYGKYERGLTTEQTIGRIANCP